MISMRHGLLTLGGMFLAMTIITPQVFAHDTKSEPKAVTHLSAGEAKALLSRRPDIQVLDVRTKTEFKRGHIAGAIQNNYFSFKFKKRLRALDRNTPYLVHCKSGHRSGRVVKIMQHEGFKAIYHLDGGYDAWKKLSPLSQNSK